MDRQTVFWVIMLLFTMLIPLFMLGFGAIFAHSAPKKINYAFGYRSSMSMKNLDTWIFAHHYLGRLWVKLGVITLVPSVIAVALVFGKGADAVGMRSVIIAGLQLIPLIASAIMTEIALRKTFDKSGSRRECSK